MRLLLLLVLVGCMTVVPDKKEEAAPLSFKDELRKAVTVTADQPLKIVRYNPVNCACPAFEVQLGSRWVRVEIEDVALPETLAGRFLARAKAASLATEVPHYRVTGDLDTSLSICARGAFYLSLVVESVE